MSKSFPDQAEDLGREAFRAVNRSLKNASEGLQAFSDDSAKALSATSKEAAQIIEKAGVRAADTTEDVSRFIAHELKLHPAATFAAVIGGFVAIAGVIIAGNRFARGRKG
jgi:hypothetical protein